jgi:hypothetical protein
MGRRQTADQSPGSQDMIQRSPPTVHRRCTVPTGAAEPSAARCLGARPVQVSLSLLPCLNQQQELSCRRHAGSVQPDGDARVRSCLPTVTAIRKASGVVVVYDEQNTD